MRWPLVVRDIRMQYSGSQYLTHPMNIDKRYNKKKPAGFTTLKYILETITT